MGLSLRPEVSLATCLGAVDRLIDLGRLGERYFVNVAGFGFDAAVAKEVMERTGGRVGGTLPYLAATLRLLRRYRTSEIKITADGEIFTVPCLFGAIGNATTYGGGMRVCPLARPDDGILDLCLAGDLTLSQTLINLVRVFRGTHLGRRNIGYYRAKCLKVEGDPSILVHADGQLIGRLPLEARIVPRAMRLLTPPSASRD